MLCNLQIEIFFGGGMMITRVEAKGIKEERESDKLWKERLPHQDRFLSEQRLSGLTYKETEKLCRVRTLVTGTTIWPL